MKEKDNKNQQMSQNTKGNWGNQSKNDQSGGSSGNSNSGGSNSSSSSEDTGAIKVEQLTLPKGGGAISGISEKVSVQDFTGSSSFSLPVPVSPCRSIAPSLGIGYSSGSGNSEFGLGWNIDSLKITRKTSKGIPLYGESIGDSTTSYTTQDTYLLGSQDLVPTGSSRKANLNGAAYTVTNYCARQEGSFSLIEYWQPVVANIAAPDGLSVDTSRSFWQITSRDHSISILGFSAKISDPKNPDHVFAWLLEESYTLAGDHQLWFYKKEDAANVPSSIYEQGRVKTANLYLERVRYGHDTMVTSSLLLTSDPLIKDESKWHFEVVFNYGEYNISPTNKDPYTPITRWPCRSDSFSQYDAGFEIRNYRLCQSSLMFHRFSELGSKPRLVHAVFYHYQLNTSGINELVSSTSTGYKYDAATNTYTTASIPDIEFSYIGFNPTGSNFEPIVKSDGSLLPALNEMPTDELIDLFGEGIAGILYRDKYSTYYSRPKPPEVSEHKYTPSTRPATLYRRKDADDQEQMEFEPWQAVNPFPTQKGPDTTIMDVTGNGQPDLMVTGKGMRGYWEANNDGSWQNFKCFKTFPTDYSAPGQTSVDITGNGLNDLIQIRSAWVRTYPSIGADGYGTPIIINAEHNPADLPNLDSTPQKTVMFSQIDGSGKQHLVDMEYIKVGSKAGTLQVSYFPNLGYGRFSERVSMGNLPVFDKNFNSKYLFMVDIDGTGASDLVYLTSNKAILYLNQSGNSFSAPITIPFPSNLRFDETMQVAFADLMGRGTTCLLISDPKNSPGGRHFYYDFCQGQKPYLIEGTNNNMGASTKLTYKSSVDFYLADKKAGLKWQTNIPFPVMVVGSVTAKDAISGSTYTSHYSYHHGHYDGVEREFKGFGRVDVQDTEYFSPQDNEGLEVNEQKIYTLPALSRTWYHVGNQPTGSISKQYADEYYQGDTKAFVFEDSSIELNGSDDVETIHQAYLALAGSSLRSEIYGLQPDGAAIEHPYSTTESNYHVRLRQAIGNNKYGVFTTESRGSISYNYECSPLDPQISQECSTYDDYSNPVNNISIAYARRANILNGQELKATASQASYIAPKLNPSNYLIGVSYESKRFDVTRLLPARARGAAYSFSQVLAVIAALNSAPLLDWSQVYYANPSSTSKPKLPLGQVTLPVLVYQNQSGVFSPTDVNAFEGVLTAGDFSNTLQAGYYTQDTASGYWFAPSATPTYDTNNFYLPLKVTDQAGNSTTYTYDNYHLMMISTQDALGNTVTSSNLSYQLLHPEQLTDINGNISQIKCDPLGQVIYSTFFGHEGQISIGFADISTAPTITASNIDQIIASPATYLGNMASFFYYDLFAYQNHGEPTAALSITPEQYPGVANQILHIGISYTDGFGRAVQAKAMSEEGLAWQYDAEAGTIAEVNVPARWLTTGAVVYDNKGNTVKAYEPYYSDTVHFLAPDTILAALTSADARFGVTPIMYYDPLDRVYQVITPKGFVVKTTWTSWTQTSYDENDTFDGTSPYAKANLAVSLNTKSHYYDASLPTTARASLAAMQNYFGISKFINTPSTTIQDNLGKTIISQVIRNPTQDPIANPNGEVLSTYYTYDIDGNLLTSSDPRLSQAKVANFTNTYGFANQPLKVVSVDAGTKWVLSNVFGNPIYSCDSRGITTTVTYDELHRPVSTKVVKAASDIDLLAVNQIINYFVYGDTLGVVTNPSLNNLRGQLYQHYDQAGLIQVGGYSLTGGVLSTSRQFLTDYTQLPNWDIRSTAPLQSTVYTESSSYDALGRVNSKTDVDGNTTQPEYNMAGLLQSMQITTSNNNQTTSYVKSITYDAKGQRQNITYGNDVVTNYSYDPKTFEVNNINSTSQNSVSQGQVIQDINYIRDPHDNIISKIDNAQDVVYYNNQKVLPSGLYTYDSTYQLIKAQGRQQVGFIGNNNKERLKSLPRDNDLYLPYHAPKDVQALETYIEQYTYDNGGNMLQLSHAAASGSFTRNYVVANRTNRSVINTLGAGITPGNVDTYFDPNGNQLSLTSSQTLTWNEHNNIQSTILVKRDNNKNDAEYYVYDSSGARVRKVNQTYGIDQTTATLVETIYLGGVEIHRTSSGSGGSTSITEEYHTLDTGVGNYRYWIVGTPPVGISSPCTYYTFTDHLGSCTLDLDTDGKVVTVEEYTPYAMSCLSLGLGAALQLKTKRYGGKEKDATGLYYYGARYLNPVSCRWMSADPIGPVDGLNIYLFLNGNPINGVDVNGNCNKPNCPHGPKRPNPTEKVEYEEGEETRKQLKTPTGNEKPVVEEPEEKEYTIKKKPIDPKVQDKLIKQKKEEELLKQSLKDEKDKEIAKKMEIKKINNKKNNEEMILNYFPSFFDKHEDKVQDYRYPSKQVHKTNLYHYTDEKGYNGITDSKQMHSSSGEETARSGNGHYFTDISPSQIVGMKLDSIKGKQLKKDQFTITQLANKFYSMPNYTKKFSHVIAIDSSNLLIRQPFGEMRYRFKDTDLSEKRLDIPKGEAHDGIFVHLSNQSLGIKDIFIAKESGVVPNYIKEK